MGTDAGVFAGQSANFDFSTGAISAQSGVATFAMTNAGNGWYRWSIAATAAASGAGAIRFSIIGPLGSTTYTGDGTSGLFLWGNQIEAGAFPTSYIPTVASTVTRAGDVAVMTGTAFSNWFNASEGTIVSETAIYSTAARNSAAYDINDTTGNNRIIYRTITTTSTDQNVIRSGGALIASLVSGVAVTTSPRKAAVAYRASDFALVVNGSTPTAQLSGAVPVSVTQMQLGLAVGPSEWINGHLRRITYYPTRLTDAQLQALTT